MMVVGRYVETFAEATHALPAGMHMSADYPFKIPRITSLDGNRIRFKDGSHEAGAIVKEKDGQQFFTYSQMSAFELIYGRKPQPFKFYPFKDEDTAALAAGGGK